MPRVNANQREEEERKGFPSDPTSIDEIGGEALMRYLDILESGMNMPAYEVPERDIMQEGLDTLAAQQAVAPGQYELTREYLPKYAMLNLGISAATQPGYDMMQAGSNRRMRSADLRDLQRLGPDMVAAIREANPAVAELLDTMNAQASADLQRGGELSADQKRQVTQDTRAAYADRGMAMGNPAITDEVTQNFKTRLMMEDRARNYAGAVLGYEKSFVDPMMALTGRPSSGLAFSSQAPSGAAGSAGFADPYANSYASNAYAQNSANAQSRYGTDVNAALGQYGVQAQGMGNIYGSQYDLWNTQYNAQAAQSISAANNRAALQSAGISAAGDIIGSLLPF
jgi:hypothetical protein